MTTQHLSPLTMLLSRHTRRRDFISLLGGAAGDRTIRGGITGQTNGIPAPPPRRRGDRASSRREFITLLGGAAAWPLTAGAQQPERVRRIGMISGIADEAVTRARLAAFLPALQRLGWTEGRNVQFEYRWGNGDTETLRKDA